jgi:cation:H+ antiporter
VLIPSLLLAGGTAILAVSAELLVRGASTLGRRAGITPIVIGLTVVSIGTSAPELAVSLMAAMRGSPDLAVGNVMGSNLANIGLILGIAAVMQPLTMAGQVVRREVPWMLGITLVVLPLLWNLRMGRVEGAILAGTLFVYLYFLVRMARQEGRIPVVPAPAGSTPPRGRARRPPQARGAWGRGEGLRGLATPIALVVGGTLGLVAGGRGIVMGAVTIASELGVPEVIVGLSVVAVGTSLPELATTAIAAIRREADLAVGNVVGSNIFNLTFVLGGTALVHPIEVDPVLLRVEYPAVLILSFFLLPLAVTRRNLDRWEGLLLLLLYGGAWVWILWARSGALPS